MNDSTKVDCPVCKGRGVIKTTVHMGGTVVVERKEPCIHCSNSGKVEYKQWVILTGRDQ